MKKIYDINWDVINREEDWGDFFTLIWVLFKFIWFLILLWISFCVVVCTMWFGLIIVIPVFYFIFKK